MGRREGESQSSKEEAFLEARGPRNGLSRSLVRGPTAGEGSEGVRGGGKAHLKIQHFGL